MDPSLLSPTFRQLQQNKQYYAFPDSLDVDRYKINGQVRDTVIAVRELNLNDAPTSQRNWYNDHIVYTHGFGVVAAYGNQRTSDGKPVFFQERDPLHRPARQLPAAGVLRRAVARLLDRRCTGRCQPARARLPR